MAETRSIYVNNTHHAVDPIAEYAMEITTIENLINVGQVNSNGINLRDRLKYLTDEIDRLEKLRRKSGRL